jgi:hypothetical protein
MAEVIELPSEHKKLKQLFIDGLKVHPVHKAISVEDIEKDINAYIKKYGLSCKNLAAKDIKKILRWLLSLGYPVCSKNNKYYWANEASELNESLQEFKAKEYWISETIRLLEKVDLNNLPDDKPREDEQLKLVI